MAKTITALTIVKNEDRWLWFAMKSVIDYVDRMIVFDDGSADRTADIVHSVMQEKEEYQKKIHFEKAGNGDPEKIGELRQRMLEMVETDYIFMLDGDEIWWKDSITELVSIVNARSPMLVAQHCINCVRDIFHFRHPGRDAYDFLDSKAAASIRMYSMSIPGIHYKGYFGIEGLFDKDEKEVYAGQYEIVWQKGKYFHMSKVRRSSNQYAEMMDKTRKTRVLLTCDYRFPKGYQYPEVLYLNPPEFVKKPFEKEEFSVRTITYFLLDDLRFRNIVNIFRKDKFVIPEGDRGEKFL